MPYVVPDLSELQDAYRELEVNLEELGDRDPRILLLNFPFDSDAATREVRCEFSELTAFCPWTKFPDQGSLILTYTPDQSLLELKSFKYYLLAFRDRHITQEHLAAKIHYDLKWLLRPRAISVKLDYMPRGGIHTVIQLDG